MSKPILYGISASRAFRSIWAMEETGIDYEHVATHFANDSKTPEFLAVNPNGRIPALVDGDLKLFESMAINLYLTKRYASGLYPTDPLDEAQVWQWSTWAISEIEPQQMAIVVQKFFVPEEKRNPQVVEQASKALQRPLDVLNDALAARQYLLGDAFSVADLNVAAVMDLLGMIEFDLQAWPAVNAWLARCRDREAYARAKAVGV